jgi:predicted nucleotidyltransferase component of viral defense system
VNREPPKDLTASVRQRLLNLARERREDFQRLLRRYAQERLLYRLSRSEHRDSFILKGALLFAIWSSEPHRPTRDLDLLGRGDPAATTLVETFRALCSVPVEPDGIVFLPETLTGREIREEQEYGGIRLTLLALMGTARVPLQVDIGFGDTVTPAPVEVEFPVLLDFPAPHLCAYPRETVVAEKLEAMVSLGLDNSRMKDFYDLWVLSQRFAFDGVPLSAAVEATFKRRGTRLPTDTPAALTETFGNAVAKQTQWQAFTRRSLSATEVPSLPDLIVSLRSFVLPVFRSLQERKAFTATWTPAGRWRAGTLQTAT